MSEQNKPEVVPLKLVSSQSNHSATIPYSGKKTIDRVADLIDFFYETKSKVIKDLLYFVDDLKYFQVLSKNLNGPAFGGRVIENISKSKKNVLQLFANFHANAKNFQEKMKLEDLHYNLTKLKKGNLYFKKIKRKISKIQEGVYDTVSDLDIVKINNRLISVLESLNYPLEKFLEILFQLDLSVKKIPNVKKYLKNIVKHLDFFKLQKLMEKLDSDILKCLVNQKYLETFLIKFLEETLIHQTSTSKIPPKELIDFLPPNVSYKDYIKKFLNEKIKPEIPEVANTILLIFNLYVQILLFVSVKF